MKKLALLLLALFTMLPSNLAAKSVKRFKVGVQCYSYKKFSFAETIEKVSEIGIKFVEIYPGQKLGGMPGVTSHKSDTKARQYMLDTAKANGVTIASYGVVRAKSEKEWRQVFQFAKDLGIEVVLTEKPGKIMNTIEKVSKEFGIKVALHNHMTPTPKDVSADLKGRNPLVGSGIDIGHWVRADLDIVKEFKKFSPRLHTMHIKDITERTKNGTCTPLGTGLMPLDKILAELQAQDYQGVLILEYEHHWDNPTPGIAQCAKYLEEYFATGSAPTKL
ncbi:MAG: sugar phosphate isomerase/epimerase [Planctomycetes bacterium]|nr:sugar phosphate isomerase/epimerase [Planctomycetota bacterium]